MHIRHSNFRQHGYISYLKRYLPIKINRAQKCVFMNVFLNRKNYSSMFYLVTLSEEIDFGRKNGKQENAS